MLWSHKPPSKSTNLFPTFILLLFFSPLLPILLVLSLILFFPFLTCAFFFFPGFFWGTCGWLLLGCGGGGGLKGEEVVVREEEVAECIEFDRSEVPFFDESSISSCEEVEERDFHFQEENQEGDGKDEEEMRRFWINACGFDGINPNLDDNRSFYEVLLFWRRKERGL